MNWTIERVPALQRRKSVAEQVEEGLTADPKTLPPVLFYDEIGSELFVQITRTDEYYPTRTERDIIDTCAAQVARKLGDVVTVIELGSGSSEKSQILLRQLLGTKQQVHYVPIDISEDALVGAAERLEVALPDLRVHCVVAEYEAGVELAAQHVEGDTLVLVLGSNLGNFTHEHSASILSGVRSAVSDDALMLVGLDMVKDVLVLLRAYDDDHHITERFNLNLLERINRELGGHFDTRTFKHVAFWNAHDARIEMYLTCLAEQTVRIDDLDLEVTFEAGERIHTEFSHKFTVDSIRALAAASGWSIDEQWLDPKQYFSLNLLRAS